MTRLELRRVAIGVRKRVELVHVVDDKGAIAGGLEGGMDLVLAKNCGLPLSGKERKVGVGVLDNVMPAFRVSWAVIGKRRLLTIQPYRPLHG